MKRVLNCKGIYLYIFIFLQFFVTNISMAERCNVNPSGWVDFDIVNNNQTEISKVSDLSFFINIINLKDMNIEIPIRSIQTQNVIIKFINLNNKNLMATSLGESPRNEKDGYISAEPHSSLFFLKKGYQDTIQKITGGKPANILAIVSVGTYLRYPSVSQPIGTYINGKFEPTYFHCSQEFRFTYK